MWSLFLQITLFVPAEAEGDQFIGIRSLHNFIRAEKWKYSSVIEVWLALLEELMKQESEKNIVW